ncbi:LOW QUALITY PROTEIN: hypothetical protein PoB_001589200 [Plakobranchus ocellatus]|uniref:Uncharacterized protein n=1 Tax=Plakobranchus ocellatus TaxID=259542 RepID=A0AAV3Z2F9_9GAST|nr:LOW QUALITY PROTEIN: hypothetical protein PoB_001589200 [Plakobranchus ocellatus]
MPSGCIITSLGYAINDRFLLVDRTPEVRFNGEKERLSYTPGPVEEVTGKAIGQGFTWDPTTDTNSHVGIKRQTCRCKALLVTSVPRIPRERSRWGKIKEKAMIHGCVMDSSGSWMRYGEQWFMFVMWTSMVHVCNMDSHDSWMRYGQQWFMDAIWTAVVHGCDMDSNGSWMRYGQQ